VQNLRDIYHLSEERTRFAVFGLVGLLLAGLAGIVWFSPTLTLALVAALVVIFISFIRPTWTLYGLMIYLPFEPFILKWVPDNLYVYARYSSELIVYLLVAVILWKLISGTLKWHRTPVDLIFAAFCFLLLASTILNLHDPIHSLLGLRQILRFVLLYFVTVQLQPSAKFIKITIASLLAIVVLQTVLGYSQAIVGGQLDSFLLPSEHRELGALQLTSGTVEFWDPGQRVFGTMGRYDQLGTFMALVLLLLVAWLYEHRTAVIPRRYWLALIIALPILALTYSRSAWFGFILGFLFIAIWAKRDSRVMRGSAIVVGLLAVYLAVTGLAVNSLIDVPGQSFSNRFFETFSAERWTGEYFGLGRVYWFTKTITTVVPSSPLFGYGPASYGGGAVAAIADTRVYSNLVLPFGVYGTEGYIDNNWFSLWGETGTLGFIAYLAMYVTLFLLCLKLWRSAESSEDKALALGVAAVMLAVALNAFLATFLEARTLAPYLWILAGFVTVVAGRNKLLDEPPPSVAPAKRVADVS